MRGSASPPACPPLGVTTLRPPPRPSAVSHTSRNDWHAVTTLLGSTPGDHEDCSRPFSVASAQQHHLFLGDRGPRNAVTLSGCPTPPPAASALTSEPEGQTCSRPCRPEHHAEASPQPSAQSIAVSTLLTVAWGASHALCLSSSIARFPYFFRCSPCVTSPRKPPWPPRRVMCHPWAALVPASSLFGGTL